MAIYCFKSPLLPSSSTDYVLKHITLILIL